MNKPELKKVTDILLKNHMEITEFYSEYAKSVSLTFSSFKVLGILWKENNCTQSVIIKKSFLPKQTVNTIIRSFINQNIIEELTEMETDKRNKIIKFTQEGKKYADEIMSTVEEVECRALDKLGENKTNLLVQIIEEYKNNLKFNRK